MTHPMQMTNQLAKLYLVGLTAVASAMTACDADPLMYQDSPARRAAYEHAATGWTRWALEQNWSSGPVLDPDGSQCGSEQSDKLWYLAGTTGGAVERECTIPSNRRLFFPLINRWVGISNELIVEGDPETDPEILQGFVASYFAGGRATTCSLTLELDGEPLLPDLETMDEELYSDVLDPFQMEMGDDNYISEFGYVAGPYTAWVAGHWAMLDRLTPGNHTLVLGGASCTDDSIDFETQASYKLRVE